jgi:hypothetical protein
MLSGLKLGDLKSIEDANRPDRVLARVFAVVEREPAGKLDNDQLVMDVLLSAARKGDLEARDLLLFGDLEVPPTAYEG